MGFGDRRSHRYVGAYTGTNVDTRGGYIDLSLGGLMGNTIDGPFYMYCCGVLSGSAGDTHPWAIDQIS